MACHHAWMALFVASKPNLLQTYLTEVMRSNDKQGVLLKFFHPHILDDLQVTAYTSGGETMALSTTGTQSPLCWHTSQVAPAPEY